MNFDMVAACSDCPFRRVGFIGLTAGRVEEIAGASVGPQGRTFSCHLTVEFDDDEHEENGDPIERNREKQSHCAGALLFAEKQQLPTQMMRVAERLGLYDFRKLTGHDDIFADIDEMLEAHGSKW